MQILGPLGDERPLIESELERLRRDNQEMHSSKRHLLSVTNVHQQNVDIAVQALLDIAQQCDNPSARAAKALQQIKLV